MGRRQVELLKASASVDERLDGSIPRETPKSRIRRGRTHVCPQCLGKLVRVHRSPEDRLRSLFAPVRRFRCNRLECGFEVTLRRRVSAKRRSMLALGGLLATLVGAVATGGFLYSFSDEPTRRGVIDGYLNLVEHPTDKFNDPLAATPTPQFVIDLQHESALLPDPPSSAQLADIALGACGSAQTAECRAPGVTPPARRAGYQQ